MVGARAWAETDGNPHAASTRAGQAGAEARSCRVYSGRGLGAYAQLCRRGAFSPAQSPAWIEAWSANVEPDYVIATIDTDGEPVFGLALEVVRSGPFKIARFMGGKHANGNFPAATPAFANSASAADFRALFTSIRQVRPDIDIVALERMVADFEGTPNPLMALPRSISPNVSLELALTPGFDAIIGRSKSLRSKHRWQIRKFEAVGGHRRIEAATPGEIETVLDEFFHQKEIRLKKAGIANIFGDPKVRAFFRALFIGSVGQEKPAFVLHALEVGGKLRAISGSSRSGERIACDLVSIAEDEVMALRPGEYLFYENIREAAEQDLKVYDFGVGDEPHKRRWCDVEVRHFDVIAPLGVKGHLLASSLQAKNRLKAAVRSNPTLWKTVKSLRRRIAGEKPEAAEQDD